MWSHHWFIILYMKCLLLLIVYGLIARFCVEFDCKLVIDAYEYKRIIHWVVLRGKKMALS